MLFWRAGLALLTRPPAVTRSFPKTTTFLTVARRPACRLGLITLTSAGALPRADESVETGLTGAALRLPGRHKIKSLPICWMGAALN